MIKLLASFAAALLLATTSAHARTPVPIIDIENATVATGTGKAVGVDDVKRAIMAAAAANRWEVAQTVGGGELTATLHVNNKHTVVVAITCAADRYSIKYLNSIDMKYGKDPDGRPVIHPYYNRWVQQLNDSIRVELRKL